ncbi:C-Myc-binding protein isoform 1-T1 [Rhynchonycteris naso]
MGGCTQTSSAQPTKGLSERPGRHENRPHPALPNRGSLVRRRSLASAHVQCRSEPASHGLRRQLRRGRCHYGPLQSEGSAAWLGAFGRWLAAGRLRAADSKREQFRRYLEKSGVLDTLTKVLVALYEEPEKPNSALDFLKHHLGAATPENPEIEILRLELAEMKEKYEAIVEENKKLKTKLAQYEPPQEEKRAE